MVNNCMINKNKNLKISLAQLNFKVGDVVYNVQKMIDYIRQAINVNNSDIVVFSELAMVGYPPEDLLLRQELYDDVQEGLRLLLDKSLSLDVYIVFGYPLKDDVANLCFNACSVIYQGKIVATYCKQELPNYGVFDERRYFHAGCEAVYFEVKNYKIALTICEDLWHDKVIQKIQKLNVDLILSLNASPFSINKDDLRKTVLTQQAKISHLPIFYVNNVGGQDDLVFDGGSMVVNAVGEIVVQSKFFQEDLLNCAIDYAKNLHVADFLHKNYSQEELVYQALVLGVRDYVKKNNFSGVVIAVSGGIDSALTLAIAVDALGKDLVKTVYMPSCYNSDLSLKIVEEQARVLSVDLSIIPIDDLYNLSCSLLQSEFVGYPLDTTEENLQARCRGMLLMAISNKKKLLVLSTSNKSEMAVGYSTLYGDMVGGFCVLKDVPKTLVYALAKYKNLQSQNLQDESFKQDLVIPLEVIERAPSAELAVNQKDSDSLPEYHILDGILELYVEKNKSVTEIELLGFDKKIVNKVVNMIHYNEYKRRQSPIGPRITEKAFDRDRRYPITTKNISLK